MTKKINIEGLISFRYDGMCPHYCEDNLNMFLRKAIAEYRLKTGYPLYFDWVMPTRVKRDGKPTPYKGSL